MAQQALEANNLLATCIMANLIALRLFGTTRALCSLELQFLGSCNPACLIRRITTDALPGSLPLCIQQGSLLWLVLCNTAL